MTSFGTFGKICFQRDLELDWKIENFTSLSDTTDSYYSSPMFDVCGRSWRLWIFLNGQSRFNSEGFIGFYLILGDSGNPLKVRYSLGIKTAEGETEIWFNPTYIFDREDFGWGIPRGILRSELLRRRDELMPQNVLTLTVTFKVWKEKVPKKAIFQNLSQAFWRAISVTSSVDKSVQAEVKNNVEDDGKNVQMEKTGGDKVLQDIEKLWLSGESSDVVLKVKGVEFKAHRAILIARSAVLGAMFKHNTTEKASGEVNIDDCEPAVFEQLLFYVYTGAPKELNAGNAPALYTVADKYLLTELKANCLRCMQQTM